MIFSISIMQSEWLQNLSVGSVIIGVIDVMLLAYMVYYFYRLMKETGSTNIFYGILVFSILWLIVARGLQMKLMGAILDQLMNVGTIALVVIFQKEIRRFFKNVGSHGRLNRIMKYFVKKNDAEKKEEIYNPSFPSVLTQFIGIQEPRVYLTHRAGEDNFLRPK